MRREVLEFSSLEEEIATTLTAANFIVLATSIDNRVTARSMSIVSIGLDVYMQSDCRFIKTAQMEGNPNVALCLGNMQIEGIAEFLGHPMDAQNEPFRALYRDKHKGSYERYSNARDEYVFVVHPVVVTLWKYIDANPCRDRLDVAGHTAIREYYE